MGKINNKKIAKSGKTISANEIHSYEHKSPIFSLEKVQCGKYCLSILDRDHKAAFADAIFKRKDLTWSSIKNSDKHGLGTEKIAKNCIKAGIPLFITADTDHFLAFRFSGKKPMVGYRHQDVFYVLWFDHDFTLYDHS